MSTKVGQCWVFAPESGYHGELRPLTPDLRFLEHHAMHYASGVFEGIRAYKAPNGRGRYIFRLDDHLRRLMYSAEQNALEPMPLSIDELREACLQALYANPGNYLRPLVYRAGDDPFVDPTKAPIHVAVLVKTWGTYVTAHLFNGGARVCIGPFRRMTREMGPIDAKTTGNYQVCQRAKFLALQAGFSEAILLSPDGRWLAEGTGQNLVVVLADGTFLTPSLNCSVLPGITRDSLMHILVPELFQQKVFEEVIDPYNLVRPRCIAEMFLCGTASEITPITLAQLPDGRMFEVGKGLPHQSFPGPVCQKLQAAYKELVTGQFCGGQYQHLLTLVPEPQPTLI